MEKSELAGNAVTFLHEEDYMDRYATPLIGVDSWLKVTGREAHSLNGDWGYAIDPFDTGFRQRWYAFQKNAVPEPHDWDPYNAETCPVPSVWNLQKPELYHYEGGVWFTRQITDPRTNSEDRLVLRFGAANYCARVFLDGEFLGRHRGGSGPFHIDLSDRLTSAGVLMVHVENLRRPDRLPCHHFDWFNYGGLHRDVALYVLPQHHIRNSFIRYDGDAILVDLLTTPDAAEATVEIKELGLSRIVPLQNGKGSGRLDAAPELWRPGAPRLYDVTITTGRDRLRERIGFRTVAVSGKHLLVNGIPVYLKGVCVHEDDQETGRVTSEADIRRRFAHVRELGANFVRLAHYPHHERVAEIADEEGIMLWEELPAYWSVAFENAETESDAQNQLAELILRDRNRASVILWGLANETADTASRNSFLERLAVTARKLDPTRPLSAACLFNQDTLSIEDTLTDLVDVVGINEYFGWYDTEIADLRQILDSFDLGKPLIISETGCDIAAGDRGPETRRNSEAFGAAYYRNQIATIDGHSSISGFVPWLLYDFRTERRQNPVQRGWNRKGLISEDKATYKDAFHVVAEFYDRPKKG